MVPVLASAATPKAVALENFFQFGVVKQGEKVRHVFAVKNKGDSPLIIKGVKVTKIVPDYSLPGSIPSGKEEEITLEFDTQGLKGDIQVGVVLVTNDPDQKEIPLVLAGRVAPVIDIVPLPAIFFSAFQGEAPEHFVTIINHGDKPLKIKKIYYKSTRFKAVLQTIKPGQEYRMVAKVNPRAAYGRTSEKIEVETNNKKIPHLEVMVNIFIKREVYHFPDKVDFGTIELDKLRKDPSLLKLLVQNVLVKRKPGKGKDFQISFEHNIPFINILKSPDERSETYRLELFLELSKIQPGKIDTFIRVKTNDKEVPELKIPVVGEVL